MSHKIRSISRPKQTNKRFIDKIIIIAAVVEPLLFAPQAYQIFRYQDASGISISAWVAVEIMTTLWLWYGYVHREKMIILYQGLFFIVNLLVIIGALKYGGRWF